MVYNNIKTREHAYFMKGQLKTDKILTSESGSQYKIISFIGAGGQGEVYNVLSNKQHYALKWYFRHMATKEQKLILENLIAKGAPDQTFLWPKDLIILPHGEAFGYIMPLRPPNYKSIVDMMKRRAEPSFYTLCRAAFNLAAGYEKLHTMGLSYRDISFGNVFFDPINGEILICDNDNVAANTKSKGPVYGTPRFMAPEIITGKANPSRNTDLYSLAVLLFYMLMLGHPLEGKLEADIKCMDIHAMNKLYGKEPLFIFDPADKRNRPLRGYQDNALIYWDLYPQAIRTLFTESFTVGLFKPNKRITEKKWMEAFANLISGISPCPKCRAEVFIPNNCWNCQHTLPVPVTLAVEKSRILIQKSTKLYSHHINNDYDMKSVIASVTKNPNNPGILGLLNQSSENWTYIKTDGSQIPVAIGKNAAVIKGAKINFGSVIGEFI